MKSSAQPFQPPRRTSRSPSTMRRVIARISAQVSSATASVSTSGVFVTTMPRAFAAGDVDVVVADRDVATRPSAAAPRRGPPRVTLSVTTRDQAVLVGRRRLQLLGWQRAGLVVDIDVAAMLEQREGRATGCGASGERGGVHWMTEMAPAQLIDSWGGAWRPRVSARATGSSRSDCTARSARSGTGRPDSGSA